MSIEQTNNCNRFDNKYDAIHFCIALGKKFILRYVDTRNMISALGVSNPVKNDVAKTLIYSDCFRLVTLYSQAENVLMLNENGAYVPISAREIYDWFFVVGTTYKNTLSTSNYSRFVHIMNKFLSGRYTKHSDGLNRLISDFISDDIFRPENK